MRRLKPWERRNRIEQLARDAGPMQYSSGGTCARCGEPEFVHEPGCDCEVFVPRVVKASHPDGTLSTKSESPR
jgi:hypothetical protein